MDKTSLTLGWLVGRQIAGQRRTQAETWEILFDGEVESRNDYGDITAGNMEVSDSVLLGDTLRLTVNGESKVMTAIHQYSDETIAQHPTYSTSVYIGNSNIGGGPGNGFENENVMDYDYCYLHVLRGIGYLYTANAGTYSVKLERLTSK